MAVLHCDVDLQPLLREHREDMASGQHKVGWFVTSRDSHPVCVDDGDFSDMASANAGPIGRSLKRLEDGRLLRGEGRFVDDVAPVNCLHVALLRSPVASGRLAGVDLASASEAPGVVAAFAAGDLAGSCGALAVHLTTPGAVSPERPILAADRIRFVGEMIAAVVADTRYAAADAVNLISPDIEPLPAVVTFEDAMAENAPLVHEAVPENLYYLGHRTYGNVEQAFEQADVIVEGEVTHPRVSPATMEGRGALGGPGGAGVAVWTSTQVPHLAAEAIAECLSLEPSLVRVVAADVGGGFGIKAQVYPEEILLAWIARRLNAPVKWIETRSEHMQAASHARDQNVKFSAAVRQDGRVLGLRVTIFSSIGAYGIRPFGPLLDPLGTAGLMTGPYDIRDYEYDTYAVATIKGRGMMDIPGTDTARVWLADDGAVHLQTTCPAVGQGSHTTFAQVAAAGIGIEPESIVVEQTDTAQVGHGTGSFMSRGSVTAATSTYRAASLLREAILEAASYRLEVPIDRVSIDRATLSKLAADNDGSLDVSVTYDTVQASPPYATHMCVVEVDAATGGVQILRYVVAEDCGVLINPMIVEGQVAGGVAQAVGAALMEEVAYGPDGELRAGTLLDYLVPSVGEMALVQIEDLVTPSTVHELGTKGVGEGGTIGGTAAIANAVADALSISEVTLPLTPDRIIALMR